MASMDAIWLKSGTLQLKRVAVPIPAPKELLLKIEYAGICGTDHHIIKTDPTFDGILGHEFVAECVGHGSDCNADWLGKTVVVDINVDCGACVMCARGDCRLCLERKAIGIDYLPGGFAQFTRAPAANCIEIPAEIPHRLAAMAEPLAAAFRVADQLEDHGVDSGSGKKIIVLGAGRLGRMTYAALNERGFSCSIYTRTRNQFEVLIEAGYSVFLEPEDFRPARAFDIVVDCTGNPLAIETAFNLILPGGIYVLKSTLENSPPLDLSKLVLEEISIIGSRCGDIASAVQYLAETPGAFESILTDCFPMSEFQAAFKKSAERGAGKVLLEFSAQTTQPELSAESEP